MNYGGGGCLTSNSDALTSTLRESSILTGSVFTPSYDREDLSALPLPPLSFCLWGQHRGREWGDKNGKGSNDSANTMER